MQAVGEPAYLQSANIHLKRQSEWFLFALIQKILRYHGEA